MATGRERIDDVLTAWEERLRRVDENLLALEAEPTYQMLAGTLGTRATLDGVTRARVSPALDALEELFVHRARLTEVLDQAKAARDSISALTFWNTDEKLAEIEALLHGPSIKMDSRPRTLAERNLLDPSAQEVAIVPEQLLSAMAQAYDVARKVVLDVQHAWATLEPAIEAEARDVETLRAQASALGIAAAMAPELAGAEHDLAALRGRVSTDPLGVPSGAGVSLAPRLAAARRRIEALATLRGRVTTELARAIEAKRHLDALHAAAKRAVETGPLEIDDPALPRPADDDGVLGLAPWLAKLETTVGQGRWQPAEVGLTRWHEAAAACIATDRAVTRGLEELLARRAELTGRLSARRAQAEAVAARRGKVALSPDLEAKATEAEGLLKRRPTPLAAVATLVEAYEAAVVALARA